MLPAELGLNSSMCPERADGVGQLETPSRLGVPRASRGKTLVVSWGVPPMLVGSASIVEKLGIHLGRDHAVIVGEGCSECREYRRSPELPPLHHVFTPPNLKGRRTFRNCMYPMVIRRVDRIARSEKVERVIGVFPDEFWLWSAYRIARKRGLPFYPFLHNTYLENRSGWSKSLARIIQNKIFSYAKTVFVANDGMREFYRANYPSLGVVTLDHINEEPIPVFEPPSAPAQMLKVAYLGTFNVSNADAFIRFVKTIQGQPDVHFTTFSKESAEHFAQRGLSGPHFVHTRVPYEMAVTALRKFDVMYLPHGFTGRLSEIEYNTIFPTRTVPYLLTGRPVLAHCPPSSFLHRWLKQNDCALIVDRPDPNELLKALSRLRNEPELRERIARNGLVAARRFSAESVMQQFWTAVDQCERQPTNN